MNGVFVFHLNNSKIHLFNYIYNDCRQLPDVSLREKTNTEDNNNLAQGSRAHCINYDMSYFEFSGKSLTSRDSKSSFITQAMHTNVVDLFCDAG